MLVVPVPAAETRSDLEESLRTAVRMEASRLGADPSDAAEIPTGRVLSAEEVVGRALAWIRQRDAGRVGRFGERVARAKERKRRIPSLNGTARFRVPDILTETELIEVKNVRRLALTPQLRDFLSYAESSRIAFVLLTRFDTVLAPDIRDLIAAGRIRHAELPGLLSPAGRRMVRRLIADALGSGDAGT